MAERDLLYGRKAWFADDRTPVRRMGVSPHPEAGVVVVSLWQGETCTATFRLPIHDAPRLIGTLANALDAVLPTTPAPPPPTPPHGWARLRGAVYRRPASAPTARPLARQVAGGP
ncbi:MAG TPA: hypothetical protein VGO92_06310 [Acidimicrobiales bacterium]|nr:hypothetical protein [Acidimicrobiales bacterium]